jgi:uncharacterized membrane protein
MRVQVKLSVFIWLTCCFSVLFSPVAQALELSPQAKISLITVSPGAELYSMYGHSAIRVHDPAQDLDIVFNYGTFDFNTPNFYVKFIRGKLPYQLSMGYYDNLLRNSQADNRSVYEQEINLDPAEKQKVVNFLEYNYQPEYRSYFYDFFYDNCATRIRDVFKFELRDKLNFQTQPVREEPLTFRQLVGIYQRPHPWVDLGIDLLMGLPADKEATAVQAMFLPDFLMEGFALAQIQSKTADGNGRSNASKTQPFAGETRPIFKATAPPAVPTAITPTLVFWILFLVVAVITVVQIKKKVARNGFDVLLFSLVGLLGILLTFLWFGTDHKAFADNLNIVWAFPLHLPLALLLIGRGRPKFLKYYFLAFAVLLLIIAVCWQIFPQEYHPAVLPIILMLALRAGYIFYASPYTKRKANPYR